MANLSNFDKINIIQKILRSDVDLMCDYFYENKNSELLRFTKYGDLYKTIDDNKLIGMLADKLQSNMHKSQKIFINFLLYVSDVSKIQLNCDFETEMHLIFYSLIFHELDVFKTLFSKQSTEIKSYLVRNLNARNMFANYILGYPINIISYLIDIGYEDPINYNIFLFRFTYHPISLYYHNYFNPIITYDQTDYLKNFFAKCPLFFKNINNAFQKNLRSKIRQCELIYNLITTYYDTYGEFADVLHIFKNNTSFLNYLENTNNDLPIYRYMEPFIIINFKKNLKSKFFLFKKELIKKLQHDILIDNINWFNGNFKYFDFETQKAILNKFGKLKLLNDLINFNADEIMLNVSICEIIKKFIPNITFYLTHDKVLYNLEHNNFNQLYKYYDKCNCDNNCGVTNILSEGIIKFIETFIDTHDMYYRNKIKLQKCFELLKHVDRNLYFFYMTKNIKKFGKFNNDVAVLNIIHETKLINNDDDAFSIYKSINKYVNRKQYCNMLILLKLPLAVTVDVLKKIYRFRFLKMKYIKDVLKYGFKIDDKILENLI